MSQRQSRGSRDSRDNPSVPKALTRKDINEQADRTVNDAVKKLNQKEDATTPQSALIRRLDLRYTELTDEHMLSLCDALKDNSSLTELTLGWNNLTDEAILALTLVCQYNTTLRSFFLFPNHSDDMNAQKIARELYNDGMYHAKADDEGTPVVLELFCRPSGGIVNWGRREDARKKREEEERLQKLKDEKMRELQQLVEEQAMSPQAVRPGKPP